MSLKTLVSSIIILLTSVVATLGTTPRWDPLYPGVPSGLNLQGNPTTMYPNCIVATNGTVYALATGLSYGSYGSGGTYFYPSYLLNWTYCGGWAVVAEFGYGTKFSSSADAFCMCLASNNLYIGGTFSSVRSPPFNLASSGPTNYVTNFAIFNLATETWSGLGNEAETDTNPVTAVAVDTNQNVYIAIWDKALVAEEAAWTTNLVKVYSNNQWVALGGGLLAIGQGLPPVAAMVANRTDVYIAGNICGGDNAGEFIASSNIIKWNGVTKSWQSMYGGPLWGGAYDFCYSSALAVCGTNVFLAGTWGDENSSFGASYGITIISTNGVLLSPTNSGLISPYSGQAGEGFALAVQNGSVYVGGEFNYIGTGSTGTVYNGIAQWTNGTWEPLPEGAGTNAGVNGVDVDWYYPYGTVCLLAADENAVYAFGEFLTVGGDTLTNVASEPEWILSGARWITTNGASKYIDPCQTTWPMIDINFAQYETPALEGEAAVGFSTHDTWNLYGCVIKCNNSPYLTNMVNLTNVFGYRTTTGISIGPIAANHFVSESDSDLLLLSNGISTYCPAANVSIVITNLPSAGFNGLPPMYDIYLYGYGGTKIVSGTEYSLNAQFTISPSGTNSSGATITTLTTSSGAYDANNWLENYDYVVFPNVPILPGTTLEITVAPDPDNPAGYAGFLNGIQIVPY